MARRFRVRRLLVLMLALTLLSCSSVENAVNAETAAISESIASETVHETEPVRIVCLGDSVTAGVFELLPCDYFFNGYVYDVEAAYPALLETALTERGFKVEVYNAGVSGDTVYDGIRRLDGDVFAHEPDIVTVCFGLNDVCMSDDPAEFTEGLALLFELLRGYDSDVKIVFMTPNMLADRVSCEPTDSALLYSMAMGNVEMTESGLLDAFMEAARAVCAENDVPVADCYAYWKSLYEAGEDISALLASGVTHPNRDMHKVFASYLLDTMYEYNIFNQ